MNIKNGLFAAIILLGSGFIFGMKNNEDKIEELAMGNFDIFPDEIKEKIFLHIFLISTSPDTKIVDVQKFLYVRSLSKGFQNFINDYRYCSKLDAMKMILIRFNILEKKRLYNLPAKTLFFSMNSSDVAKNKISYVKEIIKNGKDINVKNKNGNTPLILASIKKDHEIIELLIENKADLDVKDDFGRSALIWATCVGSATCAELLIKGKANLNIQDCSGRSVLHFCIENLDHKEYILDLLIRFGVDINKQCKYGYSPIFIATSRGYKNIVNSLIKNSADLNLKNFIWQTPIIIACENGDLALVEILVKAGANFNIRERFSGDTALIIAAINGFKNIVKKLIEDGADIYIKNFEGKTAYDLASNHEIKNLIYNESIKDIE